MSSPSLKRVLVSVGSSMAQQPAHSYQQPAASHDPYGYAQVLLLYDHYSDPTRASINIDACAKMEYCWHDAA